jgi:NADPH-dependent 2,4-dienoyl-CoA reductase/sulfur reductase-like enzyme
MKILVVGAVAAGLSAASRARRLDASAEITVLERGSRISYGACGLPYFIEGQVPSIDDLTVYTPEFFQKERNIHVRTGAEVAALHPARREAVLASGERIGYDHLVWAAGARPRQRFSDPRVFSLHTDLDALRLHSFLHDRRPKTAAVVGGGYIGLEMAGALRARGLQVELHDRGPHLLHWSEDWLTRLITERLEQSRVPVHPNSPVADPASLPHDLILSAVGLAPNAGIPAAAGAGTGRSGALLVNEFCETSLPGVFAAGDCCETRHVVTGASVWVPLGTTANKMGRVAGANAAGRRERFAGIAGTTVVRVAGLGIATTGLSPSMAALAGFDNPVSARITKREKPKYFRGRPVTVELVAERRTGRLLGGCVAGDIDPTGRINVIATALHTRLGACQFAQLDLAYAPPFASVMDPLLVAAQQLLKLLD